MVESLSIALSSVLRRLNGPFSLSRLRQKGDVNEERGGAAAAAAAALPSRIETYDTRARASVVS